ncbi:unnamed protein product [Toxocara canis]|uniref:DUF1534 domain-containing protein n=1 Tax=Toxocara canis TaxID=6265 RepID=A0A183UEQ3_TOXCA|nr:unnamed protein product [Toxocara canis]
MACLLKTSTSHRDLSTNGPRRLFDSANEHRHSFASAGTPVS